MKKIALIFLIALLFSFQFTHASEITKNRSYHLEVVCAFAQDSTHQCNILCLPDEILLHILKVLQQYKKTARNFYFIAKTNMRFARLVKKIPITIDLEKWAISLNRANKKRTSNDKALLEIERYLNVQELDLSSCEALHTLAFQRLKYLNLKILDLAFYEIDDEELLYLPTTLQELHLCHCFIHDQAIINLSSCQNLEKLNLSYCSKLKELALSPLSELRTLKLLGCKLSFFTLTQMAALSKLQELSLNCNENTLAYIAAYTNLSKLVMDYSVVKSELILERLKPLIHLKYLKMRGHTNFIGISALKNLEKLRISFSDMRNPSLDFSGCPKLKFIILGGCDIMYKPYIDSIKRSSECKIIVRYYTGSKQFRVD